jgi:hypothetical protein
MTHEFQVQGWEHDRHGDHPRIVIIGAASDHDAAFRCYIAVNVIAKATSNGR